MAQYRVINQRIQNDRKFRSLSHNAQLIFFLLITHPHMTSLGAMRNSLSGLASEWNFDGEAFREAFRELLAEGIVKANAESNFIAFTNFVKYNKPTSPNCVKAWSALADKFPECELRDEVIARAGAAISHLHTGFQKAFVEAFPEALPEAIREAKRKPSGIQEQEQEQEKELKHSRKNSADGEIFTNVIAGQFSTNPTPTPQIDTEQDLTCAKNGQQEKTDPANGRDSEHEPGDDSSDSKKTKTQIPICPHEKISELYNQILPELSQVRDMTEERKKVLRSRWRENSDHQSLTFWETYFNYVRESDFLMGRIKSFEANFDFLIKSSSFQKTIEGFYHKEQAQ